MKYTYVLIFFFVFNIASAQQQSGKEKDPKEELKKDSKDKNTKKELIRAKDGSLHKKYEFLPRVFAGAGFLKAFGEVQDVTEPGIHWLGNRYGYELGLSGNLSNNFDLSLSYMGGRLSGNENNLMLHRNFETKFSNVQLMFTYNFRNIFGNRKTKFHPFINAGAAFMQYNTFTDLKRLVGGVEKTYFYETDGGIYEQPLAEGGARFPLDRDFDYETKINGSTLTTFALPVGGGIGFNLSERFELKFGAQYYFSFTDDLDAESFNHIHSNKYQASRPDIEVKNSGNDGFLYTYGNISYNFFPFKRKPNLENAPPMYFADFGFMNTEDADMDGVVDLYDKCLGTPKLIAVDGFGCPIDSDKDGVPDYLDKEKNTSKMFVTDVTGKAIDIAQINKKDTFAFPRNEVTDDIVDMRVGQTKPSNYTVHVGTYGKTMSNRLMIKLNSIEGLVETKINDSLTVYTIGNYSDFKQAEERQNQLIESGYDQAFGVNEKSLKKVSMDLNKLATSPTEFTNNRRELIDQEIREKNKPKEDKLLFKVELTEYRLRIGLEKLATLIAQYGVEMHTTTGGLKKYTLGGFATPSEAEKLREEVIKVGLKEAKVAAYFNDTFIEMDKALEILRTKKK